MHLRASGALQIYTHAHVQNLPTSEAVQTVQTGAAMCIFSKAKKRPVELTFVSLNAPVTMERAHVFLL
jgi:hypothetical protein